MNGVVCMAAQCSDKGLTLPEVAMAPNECLDQASYIIDSRICRLAPGISMLLLPCHSVLRKFNG